MSISSGSRSPRRAGQFDEDVQAHWSRDAVTGEPLVVDPIAVEPVMVEPVAVEPVVPVVPAPRTFVAPAVEETASIRRFAPDSVITGVFGLVALVVGLIAIARAGFDGPMDEPIVEVVGFTHTTTLGLIEVGIGLCLLLAAASRSRGAAIFFGCVLGVGGFVGAVQAESFDENLALESSMAWLAVVAAVVVVAAALLMPRSITRSREVRPYV